MSECMTPAAGSRSSVRIHTPARKSRKPAVDVALGGAAVVGLAPLVVADPQRHEPRDEEEPGGDREVERDLERGRDVDEDLAGDRRVVVPAGDLRRDARRPARRRAARKPMSRTS